MPRVIGWALLLAILCATGQGSADAFRYRFAPGETVRYKMTSSFWLELGVRPDGQFFAIPMKIDAIGRQATQSVSPAGDAQLVFSIESLKLTLGNESFDAVPERIPSFTVVLGSRGDIKQVVDANISMNSILETQLYSQINLAAFALAFPEKPLPGESWSREVLLGAKGGTLKLTSRMAGPDKGRVDVRGSIDLGFPYVSRMDKGATVRAKGEAVGGMDVFLAPEIGKTRQVKAKGDMDLAVTVTGAKGAQTTYVRLRAAVFEASLLDSKAQPPASE